MRGANETVAFWQHSASRRPVVTQLIAVSELFLKRLKLAAAAAGHVSDTARHLQLLQGRCNVNCLTPRTSSGDFDSQQGTVVRIETVGLSADTPNCRGSI